MSDYSFKSDYSLKSNAQVSECRDFVEFDLGNAVKRTVKSRTTKSNSQTPLLVVIMARVAKVFPSLLLSWAVAALLTSIVEGRANCPGPECKPLYMIFARHPGKYVSSLSEDSTISSHMFYIAN